ncbi:signal transduction histidine kinase [Thioflavicoccus mobilis 8321]|uniref:histidine kinase n=1 Tax=Thioflavicoccus mobilis 8321 TaxID=765912 RepID=L0H0Y4_9GAMM|nr:ATP-binding protein [Thioflavicoccus mobilis]AGA91876.1 signal transduction histidine kinase [Thioflavicoccus mobilis 8321]
MRSIQARILLGAVFLLLLFLLLTHLALDQAFRDAARTAREERLLGQIYLLMAVAELEDRRVLLPRDLLEPRLNLPASGLYARVFDADGETIWASASALDASGPPFPVKLNPGAHRAEIQRDQTDRGYLTQEFAVLWAIGEQREVLTFAVAEDLSAFEEELGRFRTSLATWLGAMALFLLAALVAAMRWGLRPLRRVVAEVAAIESGAQAALHGEYPSELHGLTDNLNALLGHQAAQQRRLDHALGDLAHSLKTPLAVLRSGVAETAMPAAARALMTEQLTRMEHLVDYQLQRARSGAGAAAGLAPPVPIRPIVERLVAALMKVYRDKAVAVSVVCDERLVFRGPEGDLMEIVGNLLDNACKWCERHVRIRVLRGSGLAIQVEDDGPGIPPERREALLERGARADELAPGHGIGLAVARELCLAYGGRLRIAHSPLGGALVEARLMR